MIKTFEELTNEASLKGNIAIPGGTGDMGNKYLQQAEERARIKNQEIAARYGRDIPNFMGLVNRARQIQAGKEKQLEDLAEQVIRDYYESILDGVKLDIKFPKPQEIKDMMEDVQDKPEMPQLKKLEDDDIINKIQVRKIGNNITQGEAKNAKKCLELDITKDGLNQILGRQLGEEYHTLMKKITDIASFFDWDIPMEVQLEMWTRDKSGFSGSVKVEWDTPESQEDEKSAEDLAQKILGDLEDGTDIPEKESEELFDMTVPTIHALGTDFSMLLHETIKGIYELIVAQSLPGEGEEEEAETIIMSTDSLADEIEDLRYGPEIAADLRDFLNQFKESEDIVNFREKVFGKMMVFARDNAKGFLELMYLILDQDSMAKKKIQPFVDEVVEEEEEYQQMLRDYEMSLSGVEPEEEPEEIKKIKAYVGTEEPEGNEDYSTLSQREIERKINQALDTGNYDLARELSPYLKESKRQEIYEKMHMQEGYPSNRKHYDNY